MGMRSTAGWLSGPRALFAFSTESLLASTVREVASADYQLTDTGRYQHSREYVTATASACGLSLLSCLDVVLRYNAGEPVHGHIYMFRREGSSESLLAEDP